MITKFKAFTLAEVLITLGIIGVVAAITLPTLLTNIQDRVRQEQVRTVKYKFTKATDKMNSLGLIGSYGTDTRTTERFVEELKKHMNIAKVCKSSKLNECWPSESITVPTNKDGATTQTNVDTILTGMQLKALALGSKNSATVGIVTGDGVPMILVYSPNCSGFDETKQYTWSVENGKPVTNATTNCVSAIFDINGAKGPNKIGTDVRTLNSLFGSIDLGSGSSYGAADVNICNAMKKKYDIKYCRLSSDYWIGAVYACDKLGLHLPTLSTLANIANSWYGTTQIGPYTMYTSATPTDGKTCADMFSGIGNLEYMLKHSDAVICGATIPAETNSSITVVLSSSISYWSNVESRLYASAYAMTRYFSERSTFWYEYEDRQRVQERALCVGD